MSSKNPFDDDKHLLASTDPFTQDPQAQLEFQNFMLSSQEEDMLAGKVPTAAAAAKNTSSLQAPLLPLPVQQQQQGAGQGGNNPFWTIEYWKAYFNVDTKDVSLRMLGAIWPQSSFMVTLGGNPDFYGPFWVPTTVIFCLFAASTIAESIAQTWSAGTPGGASVNVLDISGLSYAAVTVYSYVLAVPALIYFTAKYHKNTTVHLFDLINIYGYGMTVWIPTSLLCVIPSDFLRWLFVIAAFLDSTFFLLRTIQPMAATLNDTTATTFIMGSVLVFQLGLSLLFKIEFFQHFITGASGVGTPPAAS